MTPHDPEEVINFAMREHALQWERMERENAALRTLLVETLRTMKEVEIALQRALDKDEN